MRWHEKGHAVIKKHEEQDRPLNIVSNACSSPPFSETAGGKEANKKIKKEGKITVA